MKDTAVHIVHTLKQHGFRAFFAGGCVRDMLLGKEPQDYDIATNAKPEQIEKIFAKTVAIGKQFGVMLVIENNHHFEIATFRSDSGYSDGRRPDAVLFTDPREDAKRRDFTINGMFYDPIEEQVLDYVNGQRDLQERLVRFIGKPLRRIEEDHLRLIRAVRFAHQINGQYHPETYKAIKRNVHLICDVSMERIRDEFNKILLLPNRSQALEDLYEVGILQHIFPELVETKGVAQPRMYHQEGSVWKHTLRSPHSVKHKASLELLWGTLLHDIGKPRTFQIDTRIRFNKHDHVSSIMTRDILKRFTFPKKFVETVRWIVAHHMFLCHIPKMSKSKQAHWILHPHFSVLLSLWKADALGALPKDITMYRIIRKLQQDIRKRLPKKLPKLLSGHDLIYKFHIPEGPKIGKMLKKIHESQLQGTIKTKKEALNLVDRLLKKQ